MYIHKEKIRKIKYLKIMKNQKLLKNLKCRGNLLALLLAIIASFVFTTSAMSKIFYLEPTSVWDNNGAWFALYGYNNGDTKWYDMTDDDGDGVYETTEDVYNTTVIFCRMKSDCTEKKWDCRWNQTNDLTEGTHNKYTITGWDGDKGTGTWSTYTPPTKCVTFSTQPSGDNHLYSIGDAAATLSVAASSSDETTVTYQWYSNTTKSNTGGTVISGATSASYTPSTSTLGTLYYYCEATGCDPEETVASNVSGGYTVYKPNIVIRVKKEGLFISKVPNIHAWYNNGSGDQNLTGDWPGAQMSADTENDGWYVYTVTTPYAPISVIFNNDGQTNDITGIVDDACYTVSGTKSGDKYPHTKVDCPAPSGDAPTVLIADAPSVSGEIATLFGYLKLTGCQDVTDYGFIWSTTQSDIEGTTPSGGTPIKATYPTGDITVGNEGTEFKAEDKVFDPQTTIYYRAYATNAIGTSYSEEIRSFSTAGCIKPVVTDIDVPASICSNAGTITATATATAGSIFAWDVDGTVFTAASGTTATATITVGAAGTGSITVTPTKEGCVGNPFTLSDITVKDATITAKNLKVNDESTTEGETIDFCEGQEITFKITSDYDVTTYTWSFPTGWTYVSGEGTKEVVVTASATSGTVSATIANDCGVSDTRTIEASVTAKPATPGTITGATSVCKGTPQTYSVEAVSGATGYEWIIPTGWTGTCSPEGDNKITATPGAEAESGTIKVKATNDCGSSEYNTGIEVTVGGYAIAISGVGAKSAAATYPWEYMNLTADTDAENITWNCVYSGTVAADLTVFEYDGKTAKLKSGADTSDTEHYTVTASSTDGGCQTTSPGYDVYINAADIEICD